MWRSTGGQSTQQHQREAAAAGHPRQQALHAPHDHRSEVRGIGYGVRGTGYGVRAGALVGAPAGRQAEGHMRWARACGPAFVGGGDGILGGVHCGHVLADAPGKNVGSRKLLLAAIEYCV